MANMKAHKLGWIGIGRMGYAMAERLAKAGCDISVWNRTRAKAEPLAKSGAKVVDSLTDLAGCDIVFTMVSTGKDGLGDPKTTHSTPTGTFKLYQKHVTTTMDSDVADHEFELRDVPWVMYFKGGYTLHGAYWHDDFGRARSHGCVNLAPIDARIVFNFTDPPVPEGWHGLTIGDDMGEGTWVHIRR